MNLSNSIAPFVVPDMVTVNTWNKAMTICRIAMSQVQNELKYYMDDAPDEVFVDLIIRSVDISDRAFKYASGEKVVRNENLNKIMAIIENQHRIEA